MMRILHAVFAALFFLGAAVQLNDPDPLRWMLIYLAAAAACTLAALGRRSWQLAAAVAVAALIWAGMLAPQVLGAVAPGELVAEWEMKDARVEIGREMYGLFIIAAWMGLIVVLAWRRRAASSTAIGSKPA
jgi:hypothetical protein